MTTPEKVAAKIAKLIALAIDPGASEEEARTAAITALKLAKQHGLAIGPAERVSTELPRPETPPVASPHRRRRRGRRVEVEDRDDLVAIVAKFESRCRVCHDPVHVGEKVLWTRGRGVAHMECGDDR